MWTAPKETLAAPSPNEEYFLLAIFHLPTGHEPNVLDDFHCSETTEMIFQEESGDTDTEPSYLCDAELDDETTSIREKPSRDSENEQIRILLERQKEQILAEVRTEIQKHNFQADSDRRSIQKLNGIIESQRREIDHTIASDEQLRRDQLLLHEQLLEQNRDLREAHEKSLNEMEELKRVQGSTFDEFSRRKSIENQDTINEVTTRIQELQNEVNCLNDWRDFKRC